MINNKRGQFYLIAAIIIIIVLLGFTGVTNFAKTKKSDVQTYELSKELNLESSFVIQYGLFNSKDINPLLTDFSSNYSKYIGDQSSDIYFVYGNQESIQVLGYQNVNSGSISLNFGENSQPFNLKIPGKETTVSRPIPTEGKTQVDVVINEKTYNFDLIEGQNFYFIIKEPSSENTNSANVQNEKDK